MPYLVFALPYKTHFLIRIQFFQVDVAFPDRVFYVESPAIAETIGDADIAITNKTPISKETIDKCPNLKFIAVLATGYNVIDIAYPLLKAKNCIITPHISWASKGSRQRIMNTTVENVKAFAAGSPENVVNM